ncbi:Hypothetical protein GLP15_456 [Giardia lamblia P15]|uniref:Uncharacterized protein n=1 Tax=Giardia intestinalis (strain P15) TaxID=658858 RepID=E1F092_GIAIA|nr:Hypothetical protein GLP15_456 [Giardia lamblia P15]
MSVPDSTTPDPCETMQILEKHVPDIFIAACGIPSPVVNCGLKQFSINTDLLPLLKADQSYLQLLFEIGHAIFMIDAYSLLYAAVVDGTLSHTSDICVNMELRSFFSSAPVAYRDGIPSRILNAFAQGLSDLTTSSRLHVASLFEDWIQNPTNRTLYLQTCIKVRHEVRYAVSILSVVNQLHKQSIDNLISQKNDHNKYKAPVLIRGIHLYNYLLNLLGKHGKDYDDSILRITRPVAQEVASMVYSFLSDGYLNDPYSEFFAVPVDLGDDACNQNVLDNKLKEFLFRFDAECYTAALDRLSPPTYVAVVAPGCSLIKNHFPVYFKSDHAKQLVMIARCGRISGVNRESKHLLDELRDIIALKDSQMFDRIKFDRCLNKLLRLSSQSLWIHLLQNGVLNHIKMLFEIAFLRQADVAQCICDGAERALKTPTTTRLMTRAFNAALEKAFSLCYKYTSSISLDFESFCERKIGAREAPIFAPNQDGTETSESIDYQMLQFIVNDFAINDMFVYDEQKELLGLFELVYTEYKPQYEFIADRFLYKHGKDDEDHKEERLLTPQQIELLPMDQQFKHRRKRSMRQPFYDPELSVYPHLQHSKLEGYSKHFLAISNPILRLLVLKYSCDNTIGLLLSPHYIQLLSKMFKILLSLKYTQSIIKSTYLLCLRKMSPSAVLTKAYGRNSIGLRLAPKYTEPSAFGLQVLTIKLTPYTITQLLLFFDRLFFFLEVRHLGPKISEFMSSITQLSQACYEEDANDGKLLGFVHANDLMNTFLCTLVVKFFMKDDKISAMLRYICELSQDFCSLISRATDSGVLCKGIKDHLRPPSSEQQHFYTQLVSYQKEIGETIMEFEDAIKNNQ